MRVMYGVYHAALHSINSLGDDTSAHDRDARVAWKEQKKERETNYITLKKKSMDSPSLDAWRCSAQTYGIQLGKLKALAGY